MGTCTFTDLDVKSSLKHKRKLAEFVMQMIQCYKNVECSISYTFVSDEYLYKMNVAYLNHNTFTDIITFDLSEKKSSFLLADIFISADRVKENAQERKLAYQDELLRVIIHGSLHLCGFKDKSKQQKKEMRVLEDTWMEKFYSMINNSKCNYKLVQN